MVIAWNGDGYSLEWGRLELGMVTVRAWNGDG